MYKDVWKKVPDAPKLYVLQKNTSACVFSSLSYAFYFISDKIAAANSKDEITPSLKENDRLKLVQDCRNISCHTLIDCPDARQETMALVKQT